MLDAKKIGRRLAQFRCAFNLSGVEAGAHAGFTGHDEAKKSAWSHCERGERVIDPVYLVALRERYGVTLDWFYCGSEVGMTEEVKAALRRAEQELASGNPYRKKMSPRPPRTA